MNTATDVPPRLHDLLDELAQSTPVDDSSTSFDPRRLTTLPVAIDRRRPISAFIGAAAAVVILVGGLFVVSTRSTSPDTADQRTPESIPNDPSQAPGIVQVPSVDNENSRNPWDPIPVASATTGWFELGDIPAGLTSRVGGDHRWSTDYTSIFYRCSTWTGAGDQFTCTALEGGNYVAPVSYGSTLDVGTQLGSDLDPKTVLWQLAQGSLWGYDQVTQPPSPTSIPVGGTTGWSYRDGDTAYLVWQHSPGVIVWIKSTGFTDSETAELAATAHPVELPDKLPLLSTIGTSTPDANGIPRSIKIGRIDGTLCAGITVFTECTRVDQGVAIVQSLDGSAPAVAALAPAGSNASLTITLSTGETATVALSSSGLGLDTAIYAPPEGVQVSAARVIDTAGATLRQLDIQPSGVTTTVVGSTTTPAG